MKEVAINNEKSSRQEWLTAFNKTVTSFSDIIIALDEEALNTIPYKDSWTAAQVTDHVTKSMTNITGALTAEGKPVLRRPDQRIDELREIFLDFNKKFNSPLVILPSRDIYEKTALVKNFKTANQSLKEAINNTKLTELVDLPIFGEITKFEIIHFVLFHTQRHLHQLEKINHFVA